MVKPVVVDLSHYNTIPQSLIPARDAGILGVIHKATEGQGYTDDKLKARWSLAQDAELLWGVYHFVRPGSMSDQVDDFLAAAEPYSDDNTLYALDYEDDGVSIDDVVEFMTMVEERTGRSPVIYSGNVLKEMLSPSDGRLSGYRLWLAQYNDTFSLPPTFSEAWLWQYSDGSHGPTPHSVPGINSPVDCNAYVGSGDLVAEWAGGTGTVPGPTPTGQVITITITDPSGQATVDVAKTAASRAQAPAAPSPYLVPAPDTLEPMVSRSPMTRHPPTLR